MEKNRGPVDDKYIVFKRAEYEAWAVGGPKAEPIDDAVVIRRQDVFAPPALDVYANAIQIAIELRGATTVEQRENLRQTADYFHEQAEAAWHTDRKLPD